MHDPHTLAFSIKSPIRRKNSFFPEGYRNSLIDIWHCDPERDGADDSCGWFIRSRHGNQETLEKIRKRFEYDWDSIYSPSKQDHDEEDGEFKPRVYFNGYFCPNGDPNLSVQGIVLNLFFLAAIETLGTRKKAANFMQRNLFEIMHLAENPHDSLFDGITRKFEIGCGEEHGPRQRKERIGSMAGAIYSWILRANRPWYRHPRWHVHHWRIQIPFLQHLRRFLFTRCEKCGSGFTWGESPVSNQWDRPRSRSFEWFRGEQCLHHSECCGASAAGTQPGRSEASA